MLATESPFPQYFDLDGTPLNNGTLFFGVANQNPETNPITVYWDSAGTQPAAQPIQTINGYAVRNGTPAFVYANSDYSQTVKNQRGNIVFSIPSAASAINAFALQAPDGSSLVGHMPTGTGAVATTVQQQLRNIQAWSVNIKDAPFYAKGDGVTDDTAAVDAAFTYCGSIGQKLYVPDGTYMLSSTVSWAVTNGFEVECSPGAVFKATAAVPVDNKLFLPSASSGRQRFIWRGGTLDGRLMPARVSGAPDLLYVSSEFFEHVDIHGVYFLCNDDLTGTAGDSCLFLAEGEDYKVTGCVFQGALDAGIYVSGDATGTTGRRFLATGNTFINCVVAAISKRKFQDHIVYNNFVESCAQGIVIGADADGIDSGSKAIITGNLLRYVGRGIEARHADGTVITNNRIEDYGYSVVTGAAIAETGILVSGSDNCLVSGNYLTIVSATPPNAGMAAIRINERTENAVTYQSDQTLVEGNVIYGAINGIREENTSSNTTVGPNKFISVTTPITLVGSGSEVALQFPTGQAVGVGSPAAPTAKVYTNSTYVNHIAMRGAVTAASSGVDIRAEGADTNIPLTLQGKGVSPVLINGAAGAESLRVTRVASQANAVEVTGSVTGSPPALIARGADTNVDLSLLPKGTGRVRFGTLTASADAPITGYIEVKDAGGVTRKLAVIA